MNPVGKGGIEMTIIHLEPVQTIHFDPSKAGTKIYLHAQWVSKNKQASRDPWSEVFIAVVGG